MKDKIRSERFEMRLLPDEMAALDELRRQQPDLPTRSEMMRRLLEMAARKSDRKDSTGTRR